MKAALGLFLGVLCAVSALAQGTIHFANTATTTLSTNSGPEPPPGQAANAVGLTSGLNHYRIGLYVAPQGTVDPNAFTLIALATNGSVLNAGRFEGGQVSVPGNTGQTIAFQVRAWTLAAGQTFEEARQNIASAPYTGQSTIGFVLPGGGAEIFGTGPGQVGGFVLTPPIPIPEPSTWALILLGLGTGFVFLKRQRQHLR